MSAFSGYVAAIEWRRVQVERPRASTSGGQSEGIELGEGVAGAARGFVEAVVVDDGVFAEGSVWACFVRARQEDIDVQVRQL